MTTDPAQGATWGEQPAPASGGNGPGKTWSGRKTAIAAGVAVVIAVGGGLAIWAGTSGDNATAQQQGPGGFGGPGGFPGRGGVGALREALHGDFVVADPAGGYVTERLQTGTVTEISATSVTLASKDGYKQTYVLDSATEKAGSPKSGDDVTVVAKVQGGTATATSLGEGQSFGNGQPRRRG